MLNETLAKLRCVACVALYRTTCARCHPPVIVSIEQALALESRDDMRDQIYARQAMRRQMVGTLYPSILCDEEQRLIDKLVETGGRSWDR